MCLADGLRIGMIIRDEDERGVSKLARGECVVTIDHSPIVDAFPSTTGYDRLLIR